MVLSKRESDTAEKEGVSVSWLALVYVGTAAGIGESLVVSFHGITPSRPRGGSRTGSLAKDKDQRSSCVTHSDTPTLNHRDVPAPLTVALQGQV